MSSHPPSSSSSSQPTVVLNLQLHASNLLLGDEKNSQEDVFQFADYRADVCADKIPNSETVRLKFLFKQQALATVDSAGRD